MALIFAHIRQNKHPALRVHTVRILLMVVIDSVAAVCGTWAIGWAPALDPLVENAFHFLVELYESVVIFSFLHFVFVCGGGPERLATKFATRAGRGEAGRSAASEGEASTSPPTAAVEAANAADAEDSVQAEDQGRSQPSLPSSQLRLPDAAVAIVSSRPPPPLRELHHLPLLGRVLPPWRSGEQMLRWCVTGTLSYVVVGAALALFGVVLWIFPVSREHKSVVWQISCGVLSAAQAIAVLALGELAVNVKEEISLLRPYGKFLSVKFVVFFGFWQGMVLQGLLKLGVFDGFNSGCGAKCAVTAIQNTLICVEMLAASIVHFYVFPPHDFLRLLAQNRLNYGEASPRMLGSSPTVVEVVDFRDIFLTAWQVHRRRPSKAPAVAKAGREVDVEASSSSSTQDTPPASSNQDHVAAHRSNQDTSPREVRATVLSL